MSWKPIVVGVDDSPEAAAAAALGWKLAEAAKTKCHLVHATPDIRSAVLGAEAPIDVEELYRGLVNRVRAQIGVALRGVVPQHAINGMAVWMGRTPVVLKQAAETFDAGLVVLGGKHHTVLGRWLAGSTAHDLLRLGGHPVLVTGPGARLPRRVLAAVDLSEVAQATIGVAQRFAALFQAELLVLHVVEVATLVPGAVILPGAMLDDELLLKRSEQWFDTTVWPLVHYPKVDRRIVRGQVTATVRAQAAKWGADVVALGSHGKNWVDRLLLGSTTERLIADLPTSLLVATATGAPAGSRPQLLGAGGQ